MPNIYIFDFDSTFIQVETLEVLADIALANHPEKENQIHAIHQITELAMSGRFSYQESLRERLALLSLTPSHLEQAVEILKTKITASFLRNQNFFKKNAEYIYILSGAFVEIVWPIVRPFGILRKHVYANRLLYDFEGNLTGYDQHYPLAQDQGKVKIIQQLKLTGDIIMIGDGYNDYEVKAAGLAKTFFAFTENVKRDSVMQMADGIIDDLEGLFISCNLPQPSHEPKKALFLEGIHPVVIQYFKNQGYEVESLPKALDLTTLLSNMNGVSLLGIRSKTEVPAQLLDNCPSLEAIGAFCIGTNQIDVAHCLHKGIAIFNAPFSNTRSVVELAISEIILLVRRAASLHNQLLRGTWHKSSQGAHEVRGKILGIIGYGNIGSQLSIVAEAMGIKVLFYDIEDKLPLGNARRCDSLEELLSAADVITLHIDGRKENHHFINKKTFDLMKEGVIFLNLSRGSVVEYQALYDALKTGKIAGLGLDVFPSEPHESKSNFKTPFQEFDNVIITPHIGGSTEEAQENIGEYVSKNLHAFMTLGSTLGSVNFPQLNLPAINYPQRIIHIHKNMPGILAKLNGLFASYKSNIEGQFLKTNEEIGYVITDINREVDTTLLAQLQQIPGTIKVKIIHKA